MLILLDAVSKTDRQFQPNKVPNSPATRYKRARCAAIGYKHPKQKRGAQVREWPKTDATIHFDTQIKLVRIRIDSSLRYDSRR